MSYRCTWLQTSCGAWDVRPSHVVNSMPNIKFYEHWDFGILRDYWISRSRCKICGSVHAQWSQEETSASWFARVFWVCTGSAFHKRNGSNPSLRNGRKHDLARTCPTRNFSKVSIFLTVQKRLETVGDRIFAQRSVKLDCYIIKDGNVRVDVYRPERIQKDSRKYM